MNRTPKNKLLVTLSDSNYIDKAKQVFSSVFFNSGWDGDYMLLSHEVPKEKLEWFQNKGILTFECKPICRDKQSIGMGHSPVILDKMYLFTSYFKKWEYVLFLDSDMIIDGSLNQLTKKTGFSAADATIKLGEQFDDNTDLYQEINKEYNFKKKSFNTGLFGFTTDIIEDDTFETLLSLYDRYQDIALCNEESILNLYFYKKWTLLSEIYNMFISTYMIRKIRYKSLKAIVYHFIRIIDHDELRPWHPESEYYSIWKQNLNKAEDIDLNNRVEGKKWSKGKILFNSFKFKFSLSKFGWNFRLFTDRVIGKIGALINRMSRRLYVFLKGLIDRK